MTAPTGSGEPFSAFMERALYDPASGFYATHRAGGARGDFITSVEVGPLFAALVGERLDRAWNEMGRPDPFYVAELGAGVGTLWRGLRRAQPACAQALDCTLVEISAGQREGHADLIGPRVRSTAALPTHGLHVIFGNEVLDNVPFDIVEAGENGWHDVLVAKDPSTGATRFVTGAPVRFEYDGGAVAVGARVPRIAEAAALVARCRTAAALTVLIDYGAPTAALAARGIEGWLRTYRAHHVGGDPLLEPGSCDITTDVPIDQLPVPDRVVSQSVWLRELGIDTLVDHARARWHERSGIGDLEAMFARSAVTEAQALVDEPGLGSYVVMEWRGG